MEKLLKIGLGLGLIWYGVLRGAKGLVLKVDSYSFRNIDLTNNTVSLNLNLLIKNPLLVGLTIKGVVGNVYVQGVQVGNVNTTYNYYISGAATHILPVIVNLHIGSVGEAAMRNIASGDIRSLTIDFDGKVYVGSWNVAIPLQFELNYNDLVQ